MFTEPVTGELTEQLRMRPSKERRTPHDDHVILFSAFEFLFEFQNRIFLEILLQFQVVRT
jgi:hypothetical protein